MKLTEDQHFEQIDFQVQPFTIGEYENCSFIKCSFIGIDLGVSFNNCIIDNASFYGTKIKGLRFVKSSVKSVDFSNADLNTALFDDCDLLHSKFDNSTLEKVDFTTSYNYAIDMDANRVKKSKHSVQGAMGLLHKYDLIIKI